jgi:hypothetical protein
MKKIVLSIFLFILASMFIFNACSSNVTTPAPAATPAPYVLPYSYYADDFEDGDLSCDIGTWGYVTDSSDGGNSTISDIAVVDGGANATSKALSVTGNISASAMSGGGYSAMVADTPIPTAVPTEAPYKGYISAKLTLTKSSAGTDLTANSNMGFYMSYSSAGGAYTGKVVITNNSNQSCSHSFAVTSSFNGHDLNFSSDFEVPSGAAYTVEDVIKTAKTIIFMAVLNSNTLGENYNTTLYVDELSFD